jgi:hypothetical protein
MLKILCPSDRKLCFVSLMNSGLNLDKFIKTPIFNIFISILASDIILNICLNTFHEISN